MKTQIALILLHHWACETPHPKYPTFVKCMADGCDWKGRFPGDISDHCAGLIMGLIEGCAK